MPDYTDTAMECLPDEMLQEIFAIKARHEDAADGGASGVSMVAGGVWADEERASELPICSRSSSSEFACGG